MSNKGCQFAFATDEFHGWGCSITGGECMLFVPDNEACKELYEDAEAMDDKEEGPTQKKQSGPTKMMLEGRPMKNNTTGVRGVVRIKVGRHAGKYSADIYATGYKRLWLGVYDTLEEAAATRRKAEQLAKKSQTALLDWFDNQLQNPYKGVPRNKL